MSVHVRVVNGDVLDLPADLLVLKYAQGFHGADRAAARRLGVESQVSPESGESSLVPGAQSVAARAVLFLGVPPLSGFGYAQIRTFGRRAIAEAARALPDATEIALTLHGPGYGLDEIEAFNSELAGVVDAITGNEVGPALRTITFVDRNDGRAKRMHQALADVIPGGVLLPGVLAEQAGVEAAAADRLSTVGYDSANKAHVFVAMPFSPEFEDVFAFGITPAAHASSLLVERMDQSSFTGDIVAHMRHRIADARLFVADVTGANPNVYLEIGFAWGNSVPTILVCRDVDELQFDLRGHRCLSYTNIVELQKKLTTEIAALLAR
ncbi:MAG TPA: hypothetical protein VH561_18040 [Micromonosporaceae bacterium]|jgi:hypothetical protein